MGDILGSVFGGAKNTSQDTTPDPISQQLNQMRLQQLQQLFGVSAYSDFARSNPNNAYTPSPAVADLYRTATVEPDLSNLMSLADYTNRGTGELKSYDDLAKGQLNDYHKLGMDAVSNYISQIAKPQIMSTMVQQGLEGGGAVDEALAKGTAEIGLPFVQSEGQLRQQYANTRGSLGMSFAQSLPGASTALTMAPFQARQAQATRAQTLMPIADYDRMLKEQDLLRQQGVATTGLTGLPYTPTTSTEGSQRQPPLFGFFGQG